MFADLRLAARRLTRAPGFAVVAIVTLALGLAATTAIFSLLDAVALRPFPYPGADRLAVLAHEVPGVPQAPSWGISKSNYFYYGTNPAIERIGIYTAEDATLTGGDRPEQVPTVLASLSTLDLLGARAQIGRTLGPADVPRTERDHGATVAVLSDPVWRARFGADPHVVGRTVRVDGNPVTVVGVLAPLQTGALPGLPAEGVGLWMPLGLDPREPAHNHHTYSALVRLRPGVTPGAAERALRGMAARLVELFPTAYSRDFIESTGFRPAVTALRTAAVGPVVRVLWLVLGGVALVLAVAAANVANLMLARREAQRRDLAVQTALGATRGRLVREATAEGVVLAGAAAAVALPLAVLAVHVTRALAPAGLPLLDTARVDWRAALVCVAVAAVVAACVGALPASRAVADVGALREGGRGTTAGRSRLTARHALVVGQVALAFVLLAGSGLLLESIRRLRAVEPGFAVDGVLTAGVVMSSPGAVSDARAAAFWRALETRLSALPGVVAAGATDRVPLNGNAGCTTVGVEGRSGDQGCIHTVQVTPGFFRAMGIRVRGTTPDWTDTDRRVAGAVVTDALATRLWPGGDAKGHGITSCESGGCQAHWYSPITGVAVAVRDDGLDRPPPEIVYLPLTAAAADTFPGQVPRALSVILRTTASDPSRYAPALRRVLAELDPGAPLGMVLPMRALVSMSTARVAFTTTLLSVAAGAAVLLAAVGLYGTLAYVVGLRRREIGVRMALGARAAEVRRLVVRQSAGLAAAGVAVGLLGALATTRLLRSLLFEVSPGDPRVLGAGVALLGVVTALASYVPARRATRVDPTDALRAE
ncbi:hypothetical protein tb265_41630 [Gemmatimonadetes bacterium T265]|nr:hypothetical protein tb265_41630 [Gemmatimonadetes bacterium T265]